MSTHPPVYRDLLRIFEYLYIYACCFFNVLWQVGRRAHVRTSDGFTGWLSLQTLDQMDIAVKVEATGKVPGSIGSVGCGGMVGKERGLPPWNKKKQVHTDVSILMSFPL